MVKEAPPVLPATIDQTVAIPVKPEVIKPYRPYLWGTLQGWGLVVIPPLVAVFGLTSASSQSDYHTALGAAFFPVLTVPMGIGILKKK